VTSTALAPSVDRAFYVYVDYFHEPRKPFYVGKGSPQRVAVRRRNDLHTKLTQGREWYRVVVDTTSNEQEAFDLEDSLIRYLETRDYQGGANIRAGGEGGRVCPKPDVPPDVTMLGIARTLYDDTLKCLHHVLTTSKDRTNDPRILEALTTAIRSERFLRDRETEVLRRELSEAREGAP
jgi:hypothetical protein